MERGVRHRTQIITVFGPVLERYPNRWNSKSIEIHSVILLKHGVQQTIDTRVFINRSQLVLSFHAKRTISIGFFGKTHRPWRTWIMVNSALGRNVRPRPSRPSLYIVESRSRFHKALDEPMSINLKVVRIYSYGSSQKIARSIRSACTAVSGKRYTRASASSI